MAFWAEGRQKDKADSYGLLLVGGWKEETTSHYSRNFEISSKNDLDVKAFFSTLTSLSEPLKLSQIKKGRKFF